MKRTFPLLLLLAWTLRAAAQDAGTFDRLECRVSSTGPVVVDRGASDGVAVGDRVFFYPRGGETLLGAVVEVAERTAVVEVRAAEYVPAPGTRVEILIPRARRQAEPEPEPEPVPERRPVPEPGPEKAAPEDVPDHPDWKNKDDGWKPDQPLLSGIRPLRPEQRSRKLSGRAYAIAEFTRVPNDDYDNSLLRIGTEIFLENAFSRGGTLHFDGETGFLTDRAGDDAADVLVRSLSYARGGTRFAPLRWEVGRFLQHGMPEFGALDGGEGTYRRANGHRFGVSMGFLPDWNDYDVSFDDFQLAAFYEWVADLREELVVSAGFQKTWHNGDADRDLLVAKLRYVPAGPEGWDVFATVWIDFYTGADDVKGSGLEVTQAQVFLTRRWASGNGMDVTYRHLRFPELLREDFLPVLAGELADNRYDRVAASGWRWLNPALRATVEVAGWNDEDGSGGSAEAGLDARDLLVEGSRTVLVVFVSFADFDDTTGARASFGRSLGRGRWDVLYEFTFHHLEEFPNDRDDIFQHRVRASASVQLDGGWDAAAHFEGFLYDDELSWSVGLSVQKRF